MHNCQKIKISTSIKILYFGWWKKLFNSALRKFSKCVLFSKWVVCYKAVLILRKSYFCYTWHIWTIFMPLSSWNKIHNAKLVLSMLTSLQLHCEYRPVCLWTGERGMENKCHVRNRSLVLISLITLLRLRDIFTPLSPLLSLYLLYYHPPILRYLSIRPYSTCLSDSRIKGFPLFWWSFGVTSTLQQWSHNPSILVFILARSISQWSRTPNTIVLVTSQRANITSLWRWCLLVQYLCFILRKS